MLVSACLTVNDSEQEHHHGGGICVATLLLLDDDNQQDHEAIIEFSPIPSSHTSRIAGMCSEELSSNDTHHPTSVK